MFSLCSLKRLFAAPVNLCPWGHTDTLNDVWCTYAHLISWVQQGLEAHSWGQTSPLSLPRFGLHLMRQSHVEMDVAWIGRTSRGASVPQYVSLLTAEMSISVCVCVCDSGLCLQCWLQNSVQTEHWRLCLFWCYIFSQTPWLFTLTFTFRAFSVRFYPKRLTINTFVRRKRNNYHYRYS